MKLPHLSDRAWLLAILAGALALRVAVLGRADLWTDEIQTLHAVRLPAGELVAERLHAGHVPVYFLLLKAWCSVFGDSQAALRMPSALLGTALLVPAWTLFRRLLGDAPGVVATILLAVHPLLVELSREARMYPLLGLAFFTVAAGAAAALDGRPPGVLVWIAALAGPLVHPTWGIAVAPLAAWIVIERRTADPAAAAATRRVLAAIGASVVVLLVALALAEPQRQELTRRPWPREAGVYVLRIFAGSSFVVRDLVTWIGYAGIWAASLVMGLTAATPRVRRFGLLVGGAIPVLAVAAGVAGGVPWGPARYVHLAAVGFVAIVAASAELPLLRRFLFLLMMSVAGLAALSGPTPWSDAAAVLRADDRPVVVDDESSRIVLSHYLGRDVHVGAPPEGAAAWRRAVLRVDDTGRSVEITDEARPR